jgi:type IV pilus assembly protein PilM
MARGSVVGLDIGSTAVRAVQTARRRDGPVVTRFAHVPLPPGAMQGGVVEDPKVVTAALRHLWGAARLRDKHVVLGVTNPQVVIRQMSVANLPEKERRKALPFQVKDALPLPVERSLLDFYPLEDPGRNETVRGLLVAAPKDPVLGLVKATESAGLHVAKVDVASFALLRAVSRLDGQVEAIVDIGANTTIVLVHLDGEPLIVRTVPRGGVVVTETVATRLGVTRAEAESLKCRVGLGDDEGTEGADVVREAVRPLIGEIRSSFAYLTAGERPAQVTRIVLSGGGALLPGLDALLRQELNVEVVIADPIARLRDARGGRPETRQPFQSSASVSVGLTLGATR